MPMSANGAVVQASDLSRRYGEGEAAVDALRGVSLAVQPGELVAVMGPSGSGKSTLMHLLAALDKPTSGTVTIAGEDVGSLNDRDVTLLRRKHIGFVFQFFNLLPMLTAEENVKLPLSIAGEKPDPEFFEDLLEARRPHRSAQAPSVGALRRSAAARRDRTCARRQAHGRLRRRADGQPRLADGGATSSSCFDPRRWSSTRRW